MLISKKYKICLLLIFFVILVGIIFNIYIDNKYYSAKHSQKNINDIEILKKELKSFDEIDLDIMIDENKLYYNKKEDIYYYYVDESNSEKYIDFELKILSNKKYKYIINNQFYDNNKGYYIDFELPISIFLYDSTTYHEIKIQFTCVPILNINVEQIGFFGDDSIIQLYGNDYENYNNTLYIESAGLTKLRGATSMSLPKKQYRISLVNGENKNEISVFGMDKDEDWILDPMYSDYSKVRSKLAFELWNQMNSYTYDTIDNDINLEYVNLYINQEYKGLYLIKEAVDRKLLDLDKTTANDSGILIKGNTFDVINMSEYEQNKKTNVVLPFELKYPTDESDYSKYWDNIIDKVYNNYFDFSKVTSDYITETFETYNYIDYKIFSHVILGLDNLGQKNIYLSVKNMDKNTKVIITPWDLDMTFGYNWSGEFPTYLTEETGNYNKLYFLKDNPEKINDLIKERYFELRKTVLSVENVNSMIDSYYNKIKYSVKRDSELWLETDLDMEIKKVKIWYENRVEYLDGCI